MSYKQNEIKLLKCFPFSWRKTTR